MEFMVTRTSGWSDGKPCNEAYAKNYMRKDIRTLKSFEEYDNRFRDNFLDTGINHKINDDGYIEREFEDEGWFVEIDTLEELLEFTNKYGDIVFGKTYRNYEMNGIEIYDDYRE